MRGLKIAALVMVAVLALSGAAATAAKAPASKTKSKPKEVTVADFYFSPERVTIHKAQSVDWV